jgi:hypothetical protein
VRTRLLLAIAAVALAAAAPSAQSDLDAFMSRVLATRDDNWKKLQQYVLEETETFQVVGPQNVRLYGGRREYQWFPRDGYFVRSPVRVDGVAIDEGTRRREEERHVRREQQREQRRARRTAKEGNGTTPVATVDATTDDTDQPELNDILRQTVEPSFISSAYFLKFKFEEGHYALVGREKLLNRDVLRIEYYPARLFDDADRDRDDVDPDRDPQDDHRRRERRQRDPNRQAQGDKIERQMNKASSVTLWVEPTAHQILQYELHNVDMDFLPGRSLIRFDGLQATMRMGEPFPGIWLPEMMAFRFEMMTAIGRGSATYDVKYSDYRLASVTSRVK